MCLVCFVGYKHSLEGAGRLNSYQKSITHNLVVVDEYGLLAVGQLNALVAVAEKHHARLLLVGDSAQRKSVEAGDGARILEKETRTTVAELREIRRQSANPAYRAAAQDLAAGRFAAGLKKLNAMGAIVEIEDPVARRAQMVECWHEATLKTKTVRTAAGDQSRAQAALMVAPTWNEIDALNAHARAKLRSAGQITGADQTFVALTAKNRPRLSREMCATTSGATCSSRTRRPNTFRSTTNCTSSERSCGAVISTSYTKGWELPVAPPSSRERRWMRIPPH